MGVEFFVKEVALEGGERTGGAATTVRVQLWDIAGQDRAKKLNRVGFVRRIKTFFLPTYSAVGRHDQ